MFGQRIILHKKTTAYDHVLLMVSERYRSQITLVNV
jgi:hypothetical protein